MELIIILSILVLVLAYIAFNLFRKTERLEEIVDSQQNFITAFSITLTGVDQRLSEIDDKGTFASDDEIGWFFESVKTLQRELNDFNINDRKQQSPEPPTN